MSTHRAHGHTLAKGTHPNAVMAELYGKLEGCSQGYGGSMHLYDVERGGEKLGELECVISEENGYTAESEAARMATLRYTPKRHRAEERREVREQDRGRDHRRVVEQLPPGRRLPRRLIRDAIDARDHCRAGRPVLAAAHEHRDHLLDEQGIAVGRTHDLVPCGFLQAAPQQALGQPAGLGAAPGPAGEDGSAWHRASA